MRHAVAWSLVLAAVAVACPSFDPAGVYRCDTDADCPPAHVCSAVNICVTVLDGEDAGASDAGEPDAGDPDAGTPDAGAALVTFINTDGFAGHALWWTPAGGQPLGLHAGVAADRTAFALRVPAGAGVLSVTTPADLSGAMPESQVALQRNLLDGDSFLLVLLAASGTGGTPTLVLVPPSGDGDRVLNGLAEASELELDVDNDDVVESPRLTYGASYAHPADNGSVLDRRIRFSTTNANLFVTLSTCSGQGPLLAIVTGRTQARPLDPDAARVLLVRPTSSCPTVLQDPWISLLNTLTPDTPLTLVVGSVSVPGADSRGKFSYRIQVPPGAVDYGVLRANESAAVATGSSPLARGQSLFPIAYRGSGGAVVLTSLLDAAPLPAQGCRFDIVNAIHTTVQPNVVASMNSTVLFRDATFGPGDRTTEDGSGVAAPAGTLEVSIAATGLPLFSNTFQVATSPGERLLLVMEDGGSKPNLRVVRNPGPLQTVSLLVP